MEGIIAIIIIVISLITSANKAKKIKQNAPGQSGVPMNPVYPQSVPHPVQSNMPSGSFAEQVAPKRPVQSVNTQSGSFAQRGSSKPAVPVGHQAVGKMAEGASRECGHGSVGGSMAYQSHTEGNANFRPIAAQSAASQADLLQKPAMTADEMRRAIIMAEVLKRPQERMAEQSRRWNVR